MENSLVKFEMWKNERGEFLEVPKGYVALGMVYAEAIDQAAMGKGKERHASDENFEDQQIVEINKRLGSEDGALFQAVKKIYESKRLPFERAKAELLGAMNYLAAAIIVRGKRDGFQSTLLSKERHVADQSISDLSERHNGKAE